MSERDARLSAAHNASSVAAIRAIVTATLSAGGDECAVLVALESTVLGTLLACEAVFNVDRQLTAANLEVMTQNVLERLTTKSHGLKDERA